MKLIVGLGNPGTQYRFTRHNVGFMVLDRLAAQLNVTFDAEKFRGQLARTAIAGEQVLLLKPQTFMNLSGVSVAAALRNRPMELSDLLVVTDDVNLRLGWLRLRGEGSAGGHNGLKSIIEHVGTLAFPRLRIGVGENKPGRDLRDHVLGTFYPDEKAVVEESVGLAVDGVTTFVMQGIAAAMNKVNGKRSGRADEPGPEKSRE